MRRDRVLILLGAGSLVGVVAQALGDGSRIVTCDDSLYGASPSRGYPLHVAPEKAQDYALDYEVGRLRRENRWREKQARAMINARIKAQKRGGRA
jgi:hypothetical protein